MAVPVFSKPKQPRFSTDYSKCLICQKTDISDSTPLYNLTDQGYGLLKTAVETRTDDIAIRLSNEIADKSAFFLKQPKCDKTCKGNYARTLYLPQQHGTTLSRQDSNSSTSSTDSESSIRSRSSLGSSSINYKQQCFICERARSKKGERNLRLIEMQSRQKSIWDKAKALNDEAMLHKIQGFGQDKCIDMVAQDFRYHGKCMDWYLYQRVPSKQPITKTPFEQAFEHLIT